MVFDKAWFDYHQRKLFWLLNSPLTKRWFRWVLCIDSKEVINRIEPNAYWFGAKMVEGRITVSVLFKTHNKYAKRLYYAFKPVWLGMHIWDLLVDVVIPRLSLDFSTLTVFPDAGNPGTTTCDGVVYHVASLSWTNIRNAAGNNVNQLPTPDNAFSIEADNVSNTWIVLRRSIYLFDTSSIGSGQSVTSATLSLSGNAKSDALGITPDANIYSSAPASNTVLAGTDYTTLGTTAFATAVPYASLTTASTYTDFALNASGIANIAMTGISKFGCRNANFDVANVAPTWTNSLVSNWQVNTADTGGTVNDPQLVVNYSIAVTGGTTPLSTLLLLGVG